MKFRLCVAALFVVAFTGGAFAQSAPADKWAGFYVGANAGFDLAGHQLDATTGLIVQLSSAFVAGRGLVIVPGTTVPLPASDFGGTGFVGGGQAGYAFALDDNWVLGAEGDLNFGGHSSTVTSTASLPATALQSASSVTFARTLSSGMSWSVRARAGYAWDEFLLYATAGVSGSHFKVSGFNTFANPGGLAAACSPACQASTNAVTNTTTGSLSDNHIGWAIGGGGEMSLGEGISIGLEFRHNDYGSHDYTLPTNNVSVTAPTVTSTNGSTSLAGTPPVAELGGGTARFMDDAFTVRLNFHL